MTWILVLLTTGLRTMLLAAVALMITNVANADIIDPLHGAGTGCTSNGTNLSMNGTGTFGWNSSPPGLTGTLYIDFLIPNDVNISTFVMPGVTGFPTGHHALFAQTRPPPPFEWWVRRVYSVHKLSDFSIGQKAPHV